METSESLCDAEKLFSEISRVLTPGGRYICVTLAQVKSLFFISKKNAFIDFSLLPPVAYN